MKSIRAPEPVLACVPDAIPADERKAHFALAERVFRELAIGRTALTDGYAITCRADALISIAQFVANERLCCPFLRFVLELEPAADTLLLRMTGPTGTRDVLDAELQIDACGSAGCACNVE
jgi:hypothetical protein